MSVDIEVIADPVRFASLAPDWDRLVIENPEAADGLDATTGFRWFCTLIQTFETGRTARIVVLREGGELVGLLPLVATGGGLCKRLAVASELYGGRNGLILARDDPQLLGALMRGTRMAFGPWQSLKLMVVEGSRTARLLQTAAPALGLGLTTAAGWESPYFPLAATQDEFLAGVSKGLKQTIRTSVNKLKALGEVHYEDIGPAQTPDTVLQAILDIERSSWKHEAGSAITCRPEQERFYRNFFDSTLGSGLVYGILMYLDNMPIAYNFGLLRSGYYSCLKHSNRQDLQNLSPNQVLNVVLIERLRDKGVAIYDYMGAAEPHKLRWSGQTRTYLRNPTWIFSRSPCGVTGHALLRLKNWARNHHGSKPPETAIDSAA